MRELIVKELKKLHPSEAIAIIESIGKELRKANSIRINNNQPVKVESDRPDLMHMK